MKGNEWKCCLCMVANAKHSSSWTVLSLYVWFLTQLNCFCQITGLETALSLQSPLPSMIFCRFQVDSQSSILASSANCRIWLMNSISISQALFSLQDSIVVVRILLIVVSLESHIKYVSSATVLLFLRPNAWLWANTWILNQKISWKCFVSQSTTVTKVLFARTTVSGHHGPRYQSMHIMTCGDYTFLNVTAQLARRKIGSKTFKLLSLELEWLQSFVSLPSDELNSSLWE